jgi:glycosyltransferase involved in cell wall biosynthesis
MKVVFVHQDGRLTGSAFSMINLINGFHKLVDVHVVLAESGPLEDVLKVQGINHSVHSFKRFWTFPGPRWHERAAWDQLKALNADKNLTKYILSLHPDIVHLNDKACIQAGISLKNSGLPLLQHLRSSYYPTHALILKKLSARLINSYATHLIAISEDETDGFDHCQNLSIIFNTLDLVAAEKAASARANKRQELSIQNDELVIAFMANISGAKGAWDFLEMALRILKQFPEKKFRFIMAGNMPSENPIKGLMERLGLRRSEHPVKRLKAFLANPAIEKNVMLLGFRSDNLELISAADILVVCTRLGVLGRQPFEAMAVKTPVVATAGHSGKSKVILHEQTGLVVPMKNVQELTKAVSRLVLSPDLRKMLEENGYAYAQKEFNPSINSVKVLKIYHEMTNNPKKHVRADQ